MRWMMALLLAAVARPAEAGPLVKSVALDDDWLRCDGYQAPTRKADSLTTESYLMGLGTQTTDHRRAKAKLGVSGIAACDRALADPLLQPVFAMRRAHLLQAKAIHLITAGKFEEAVTTLRLSTDAGRAEALFDQSLGQGNRALSAIALHGLGRKAEAEAALVEMDRHRPWATSQRQLSLRVRMQFDDALDVHKRLLAEIAPQMPSAHHQLFWTAMLTDDWDAALRLAPGVRYEDPRDRGNWQSALDAIEPYLETIERVRFAGALAYAQAAAGHTELSARTLADARTFIATTMTPLPELAPGQDHSSKKKLDYQRRKMVGDRSLALLREWAAVILLRAEARKLTLEELNARIATDKLKVPTLSDIVANANAPDAAASIAQAELLKKIKSAREAERLKSAKISFDTLVTLLPRPETPSMKVRYVQEGGILGDGLNGFAIKKSEQPNKVTVRFGSGTGSLAMVDEGVMLAAAQRALKQGKSGFVIDAREPIQRTIRYVGRYSGGQTTPSGYEVRLLIRMMNESEADEADRARLIPANAVVAALGPRLIVPASPAR